MPHHPGGYHAGPYCERARGLIGSQKLDAQADARRTLRRGRFAKTTPEIEEHAIQYVASDEGLWGTSVKERHATKGRESVSSAVNRGLRGGRGVVESDDTTDEAGAVFRSVSYTHLTLPTKA